MGQAQASLKEGFLTCGNRDSEEKVKFGPQSADAINLLEEALKQCGAEGLLDRTDLVTRWKSPLSDNFIYTNANEAEHYVYMIVPEDGEVKLVTTRGMPPGSKKSDVMNLALQTDQFTCFSKDKPYFRLRVYSEEANYLVIRRCKNESEVVDCMLEALQTGVDNLDVTICREVLELEFDKVQIVEEYDSSHPNKKAADLPKQWLITHFLWATVQSYRLEGEEELQKFFVKLTQALNQGKQSSAKAETIKEMRQLGRSEDEIERLGEAFGDGSSTRYRTARYLHLNAARAKTRKFNLIRNKDKFPKASQEEAFAPSTEESYAPMTVEGCAKKIMKEVESARNRIENWQLLLAWEPGKYITVEEHMHQAKRCQMRNNISGLTQTIQHIVEFLNKHGDMSRRRSKDVAREDSLAAMNANAHGGGPQDILGGDSVGSLDRLPKVKPDHMDLIFSVNKKVVDTLVTNYLEGLLTRERFEEQLITTCERMIRCIDNIILPWAAKDRSYTTYAGGLRTKADYMRYLSIYLPTHPGATPEEVDKVYADALRVSEELKPRELAATSSCVNYALFLAEVKRDVTAAAALCRETVKKVQARELLHQPTPSEIFNWTLLLRNMEAFECTLVMMVLRFDPESLSQQNELPQLRVKQETEEDKLPDPLKEVQQLAAVKQQMNCFTRCGNRQTDQAPKEESKEAKKELLKSQSHVYDETPELSAVRHWLQGRPLNIRPKGDGPNNKGHDNMRPSNFKSVRWIESVEEIDQAALPDVVRANFNWEEDVKTYLIACVVLPQIKEAPVQRGRRPLAAGVTSQQGTESKSSWCEKLQQEIYNWPIAGTSHVKDIMFGKPADGRHFANSVLVPLDDNGIIQHSASIGDNPYLYPGDTIIVEESMSVHEFKAEECQKLANLTEPVAYRVVPCLKVSQCHILGTAEYVEVHGQFLGFPQGQNLKPSESFSSLDDLRMLMQSRETEHMDPEEKKVVRRRIAGLSARRDPKQASNRGCK